MNQSEEAAFGSLQTRVLHVEQSLAALGKDMREGFAQNARQVADIASRFQEQVQAQATRFEQERKPQWQAYGVMLTGIVVLGTMAYWPIREQQTRLEALVIKMDEGKVSREEFALTQERGKEYRERSTSDLKQAVIEVQRQIDDLKKQAGETYSLRDVVVELKQNQKEMQEMVLRGRAAPAP